MKVSKAIKMLKEMNPDAEIVIEWWDVHCFHGSVVNEDGAELPVIPHNVWDAYAEGFEFRDTLREMCWDDIQWGLQDYVTKLELEARGLGSPEKWVSGKKKGGE